MSLAPGVRLGAYEVIALIGSGGMGEVYRARDTRLAREVAVKVLPPGFSSDPNRLRRFEQEARAAAALNHPNILAVHDIGDGGLYIVSELLEGETLRDRLSGGPLPVRKAIEYGIQIAHGLAAAHEKAIVHRDLKPENVFITRDGRAKILDFGLAKLTQPDSPLIAGTNVPTSPLPNETQAGLVLGTIGYMAPEQVRAQGVDHRADVFAFGAVLYEMLCGRRAFKGDTTIDTMTAILKDDPPDLPVVDRHIPPALARIVDRCLEKSADSRFHSMHDLAIALETLSSHTESTPTVQPVEGMPARSRRWLPWALAAVTSLVAIAVAGSAYVRPTAPTQTFRATLLPPDGVVIDEPAPSRLIALRGDAVPVAEQVQMNPPTGAFSVSQTGILAYKTGETLSESQLTWFDSSGRQLGTVGGPGAYGDLHLSADGRRASITLPDGARATRDLWIVDLVRNVLAKFTFDPADDHGGLWFPDSSRIVFRSNRSGSWDLYEKPSSGAGTESVLLADKSAKAPLSWSPDGKFLLYANSSDGGLNQGAAGLMGDLWVLPLTGERKPFPFIATPFIELPARFSPDGRWVAYQSNESGRPEVYIAPFPGPGGKWLVSASGGGSPVWRRDGKELFYLSLDFRLMAAPLTASPSGVEIGSVRPLFAVRPGGPRSFYDVTADGRFLVIAAPERSESSPITLVVNWAAEVQK